MPKKTWVSLTQARIAVLEGAEGDREAARKALLHMALLLDQIHAATKGLPVQGDAVAALHRYRDAFECAFPGGNMDAEWDSETLDWVAGALRDTNGRSAPDPTASVRPQ